MESSRWSGGHRITVYNCSQTVCARLPVAGSYSVFVDFSCAPCSHREREQPYFLYVALAHMHVPLAPPLGASAENANQIYAASLQEMDGLVGAIKAISDQSDQGNTLIWFTG